MNDGCVTYVWLVHVTSDLPNMYVSTGWFKSDHTAAGWVTDRQISRQTMD